MWEQLTASGLLTALAVSAWLLSGCGEEPSQPEAPVVRVVDTLEFGSNVDQLPGDPSESFQPLGDGADLWVVASSSASNLARLWLRTKSSLPVPPSPIIEVELTSLRGSVIARAKYKGGLLAGTDGLFYRRVFVLLGEPGADSWGPGQSVDLTARVLLNESEVLEGTVTLRTG